MTNLRSKTMTATRGQYGQWVVHAIINGVLVHRQYYGYTKQEAMRLFRSET